MGVVKDLTGQQFGRLTVLGLGEQLVSKSGKRQNRWRCSCSCGSGKIIQALGYNLKNGNTSSCGCLQLEKVSETGKKTGPINGKLNKKYNTYDLTGEYGIGYTLKGEPFYFDLEDYDKIKDICWYMDTSGYVVNKTDSKITAFHRLVMGLDESDKELQVDHIFHKTNDNRKSQLRIVSPSQNGMNKGKLTNNTSGIRGVWFNKRTNKWCAEIQFHNQKIYLGEYLALEEAAKVRKIAEEKYFKEYNYKGDD